MKPLIGTVIFATGVLAGFLISRNFFPPDPSKVPVDVEVVDKPTRLEVAIACNYGDISVTVTCKENVDCGLEEPLVIPLEFVGLNQFGCRYSAYFPTDWGCNEDIVNGKVDLSLQGAETEDIAIGASVAFARYGPGGELCHSLVGVTLKRQD